VDGRLVLAPDATVPAFTDAGRTLALAGVAAQWAYPAADTLMGARFVAHAFARRCRTR
jgi:NADP-dependent 3-hydroxy acid dehydrogenase YdfG